MPTRDETGASPPPLPNTYWIEPGRLLAGEYPATPSRADTLFRLNRLIGAGITCFIDLTEPGELNPYDSLLPNAKVASGRYVVYVRKPIHDHSVPPSPQLMSEIHAYLDQALEFGHCVYLHCQAGVGRTGTVLGCYFVHQGMVPDAALDRLNALWRANSRSRDWPQTPETDEQYEYVLKWRRPGAQPAPVEPPQPRPEELVAARAVRDRYQGAMLGLAVGDALGASVQFRAPGSFPPLGDLLGGGPFEMPRGGWTDETAMALCLAESLVECEEFDPADQMARYRLWQREGHLSSTGQCVGITATVARALAASQWSGKPFAGSHDPARLDKDALTRVAPAVLFYLADPRAAVQYAAEAARTTDQSPIVLDACRHFAALLVAALQGASRQQLLNPDYISQFNDRPLRPPVAAVAAGSFRNKSATEVTGGGGPVEALEAALWAFYRSQTFREGALLAVNLGVDSDVVGALFGQLGGAFYGVNAIPSGWRSALLQRELIEQLADRLLAASLEKMAH
jgi:ADP-ribosylglycohydrolase